MWIKNAPNLHEKELFLRAQKYIECIKNIHGIKMIAICNSLSMFATKSDSDIDLFIVTDAKMLWYVRFFVTLKFWKMWVWRKWTDIAGNFCLSFFVTEKALDFQKIALKDDIYLYYWIYFLKPILDYDATYDRFLSENSWVKIPESQKQENLDYRKFVGKSLKISWLHSFLSCIIQFFGEKKTTRQWKKMGKPQGVIISSDMLKFHDKDQRENVKKAIQNGSLFEKDF